MAGVFKKKMPMDELLGLNKRLLSECQSLLDQRAELEASVLNVRNRLADIEAKLYKVETELTELVTKVKADDGK